MFVPMRPVNLPQPALKPTQEPCWSCGGKAKTDEQDRALCDPCRQQAFHGPTGSYPGPVRILYTTDDYMRWCWRCCNVQVPLDDPWGACSDCSEELRHG